MLKCRWEIIVDVKNVLTSRRERDRVEMTSVVWHGIEFQWRALLNTAMNLSIPQNAGHFLTS
jgi:hypothetical protein